MWSICYYYLSSIRILHLHLFYYPDRHLAGNQVAYICMYVRMYIHTYIPIHLNMICIHAQSPRKHIVLRDCSSYSAQFRAISDVSA